MKCKLKGGECVDPRVIAGDIWPNCRRCQVVEQFVESLITGQYIGCKVCPLWNSGRDYKREFRNRENKVLAMIKVERGETTVRRL